MGPGPVGWMTVGEQVMIGGLMQVPERHTDFPPRAEALDWELQAVNDLRRRIGGDDG